jgi:hypothetical protein
MPDTGASGASSVWWAPTLAPHASAATAASSCLRDTTLSTRLIKSAMLLTLCLLLLVMRRVLRARLAEAKAMAEGQRAQLAATGAGSRCYGTNCCCLLGAHVY